MVGAIGALVSIAIKSAFVLLALLFVNRFLKFDYGKINLIEEAVGKVVEWFREHHLSLKANLQAAAGMVALALFVNWYAELDNGTLNSVGGDLKDLVRGESWNNIIPALDSLTRIMVYMIMLIALNRFFRLEIELITRIDNWLYDYLDRLILSHGGVFELVSKTVMTLIVAMTVNYHAEVGFVPLTWLQKQTVATLGLEGLGEGSAARRARRRCQGEQSMYEMRANLMRNAMFMAEAEGRTDAAIAFRDKLDNLAEQAKSCQ
ncbi:MAG: hypothetical protein OEZ04_04760 [Nitrospinota bacterium]|nr:hypothetical protein [Nitrospinota bacterium]